MKKIFVTAFVLLAAVSLLAQGLVNFADTPATLVYEQPLVYPPQPSQLISGPPGSWFFGLFLGSPQNSTFTGLYATNTGVQGLFSGGIVAVPGWPAGVSRSYFVAGWDTSMGHDFNPLWLVSRIFVGGDFGVSPVGSGAAGNGSDIPTLNLFDGGGNTLTVGMEL